MIIKFSIFRSELGSTLVEVLVAIALMGVMLPTLAVALITGASAQPVSEQKLKATSMQREAVEAVRVVREKGWNNLIDGTYHPVISANNWSLVAGPETINGLTRNIVISSASRNVSGVIVTSGGTVDSSTKLVTVNVSWTLPYNGSIASSTYLSRWQNNTAWTQSTAADFTPGIRVGSVITNTAGGEVQLTNNWTAPIMIGSADITGLTDGSDVFVDSVTARAYVVNGASLSIINVANPAAPVLLGTYAAGLALNGVYVVGNYAYLASSSNNLELTVINVTNPAAPLLAAGLDLGDNNDATSVYVTGGFAYIGKLASATGGVNEFYIVNAAVPTAPVLSGSLNLTGAVNSIFVSGNFAYVATAITTAELTVINVTNKAAPISAGIYNAAGTVAATDVFAVGTTVYFTNLNNTGGAEFFIVNAAVPAAITLIGSYEAGSTINGVFVVDTQAYLATATTNRQFTVLNIAVPATPTLLGSTNLGVITNDIFVAGGSAYLASTDNALELTIIGGPAATGTFESNSFDAGASAGYHYLNFTITKPFGTNAQVQVATNNNNTTWNYLGPDGTAATFFTVPGAISFSAASGRYLRYKLFMSGTTTISPVVSDVTLQYSP